MFCQSEARIGFNFKITLRYLSYKKITANALIGCNQFKWRCHVHRSNYSGLRFFIQLTFITKWRHRSCLFSNLQAEQFEQNKFKLVLGEIVSNIQRLWLNVILLPCVSATVNLGIGDKKHGIRGLAADWPDIELKFTELITLALK